MVGLVRRRVREAGGSGSVREVRQHVRVHEQVVVVLDHGVRRIVVERRRAHRHARHRVCGTGPDQTSGVTRKVSVHNGL